MSLPAWVESVDDMGMSEQDGIRRLREALSIAVEALEKYGRHTNDCAFECGIGSCTCGFGLGKCEALRRIESLGESK